MASNSNSKRLIIRRDLNPFSHSVSHKGFGQEKNVWKMAAKAYVVSMTVTELKEELKQRGLSTRGSKKSLRDRLEQVGVQ